MSISFLSPSLSVTVAFIFKSRVEFRIHFPNRARKRICHENMGEEITVEALDYSLLFGQHESLKDT